MSLFENDEQNFVVVVNSEGQYSIWPEGRDLPAGWFAASRAASRADCLKQIESIWETMQPRSLTFSFSRIAAGQAR